MDCFEIFNYLPESVFILNLNGNIIYANKTFESNIAPFDRVENLEFVEEFVSNDDINRFQNVIQMTIKHENSNKYSNSYPITNCRTLCFGNNDFPLYRNIDWMVSCGKNDAYLIITGRFSNYNDTNNNEEDIERYTSSHIEIESELAEFFQKSPIALHWLNSKGVIIWANQAELSLLGYESHEYVNHHITEVGI
mgnify:CR=1 FL=1